ncbi:tetratricopeptide [Chaetomium sp. MPI-SDFR-AT-0129]|nr:tetratricopeptide [Chaetomium sp. MPI-SDFR-AT-0129]
MSNTVYLTEQEAARIKTTVLDSASKRASLVGDARTPRIAKDAISQATGAALMADMGAMSMGGQAQAPDNSSIPALAVGQPYAPCVVPATELKPMGLADLRMETHHRGFKLVVKRASPVVTGTVRSWAMVQDEKEETERIEVVLHTLRDGKDVLESAKEFVVKEPYFTLTEEGEPTLRIDHPSDLVVVPKEKPPAVPATPEETEKKAVAQKTKGNNALGKNELIAALAHYTAGITLANTLPTPDLARDIHRNRSHVNLLLQHYDAALSDALAALINPFPDPESDSDTTPSTPSDSDARTTELDAKSYFRAATAAYHLTSYPLALRYFQHQKALMPTDRGAAINIARSTARVNESQNGTYDFAKIRASFTRMPNPAADAATWKGPTEVRDSAPGKGRGLFATRALTKGEVVVVEKGFAVAWGTNEAAALKAMTCDIRDERMRVAPVGLERAVVDRAINNPSLVARLMTESFGDWDGGAEAGTKRCFATEDGPVVDVFRVHDIIARNAFGVAGRDGSDAGGSAGFWPYAALINHSCVPNTQREFVGDLMVIRATKPIAKGVEIVHSYDESGDYAERQEALLTMWGFECTCVLCEAEKGDEEGLREKRGKLAREADELLKGVAQGAGEAGNKRLVMAKARRLVAALEETYDEKRYKGLPRLASQRLQHLLKK